jgi:hypothetical protein
MAAELESEAYDAAYLERCTQTELQHIDRRVRQIASPLAVAHPSIQLAFDQTRCPARRYVIPRLVAGRRHLSLTLERVDTHTATQTELSRRHNVRHHGLRCYLLGQFREAGVAIRDNTFMSGFKAHYESKANHTLPIEDMVRRATHNGSILYNDSNRGVPPLLYFDLGSSRTFEFRLRALDMLTACVDHGFRHVTMPLLGTRFGHESLAEFVRVLVDALVEVNQRLVMYRKPLLSIELMEASLPVMVSAVEEIVRYVSDVL